MRMFCGIDEAGRGSVMGPLVVAAVGVEDDSVLKEIGVKDSKRLSPKTRRKMFTDIVESSKYSIIVVSASEIDSRRARESLNEIEMDMFAQAAWDLNAETIYADCPDVNEASFSKQLSVLLGYREVIAKHKADDIYPVVSAASIIAKVTRDHMISEIEEQFGTDIGSGYPSDTVTMEFIEKWIKDNGRAPEHTRCSWEPVRKMMSVASNTKITDW